MGQNHPKFFLSHFIKLSHILTNYTKGQVAKLIRTILKKSLELTYRIWITLYLVVQNIFAAHLSTGNCPRFNFRPLKGRDSHATNAQKKSIVTLTSTYCAFIKIYIIFQWSKIFLQFFCLFISRKLNFVQMTLGRHIKKDNNKIILKKFSETPLKTNLL